jgi:hypothetical protein
VSLIQDEDLEPVTSRGKDGALSEVSGIVDTVVAGSVNLNNI